MVVRQLVEQLGGPRGLRLDQAEGCEIARLQLTRRSLPWVLSDTLGRCRSSDDVRYASNSDGIAAPPRSAALGRFCCKTIFATKMRNIDSRTATSAQP
jgi:hypothetical protein